MRAVIPLINSGSAFMTVLQRRAYSSSMRALPGFSLTPRAKLKRNRIVVNESYPFITATNFGKNRTGILLAADLRPITPIMISPHLSPVSLLQAVEDGERKYLANGRSVKCPRWRGPCLGLFRCVPVFGSRDKVRFRSSAITPPSSVRSFICGSPSPHNRSTRYSSR
jgi:hypothetical protein